MTKDGAWFGIRRTYWRERERERGGSCCEDKWLLDMWGVPTYDSKFTFFPNRECTIFHTVKLDIRRCEKPILTGHYILHPQPKSWTCFYADYVTFLGEIIYYMYIITRIIFQKSITLRICKIWTEMSGNLYFSTAHITKQMHQIQAHSIIMMSCIRATYPSMTLSQYITSTYPLK